MIKKILGKHLRRLFLFLCGMMVVSSTYAQSNDVYVCKDVFISFYAPAPIADVAAQTSHAVSAINMNTGEVFFKVPMRSFDFKQGLMRQHFNNDYLQTEKYPFATFDGKIENFTPLKGDGTYPVTIEGKMTIHGVTKEYTEPGTLELKNGRLTATTAFNISVTDHHIEIPSILSYHVAKEVAVKMKATYALQDKK